jgi:hypothetical protein
MAGGSGFAMTRAPRKGMTATKARRMPFIAANGLLVLIPSALFLASKAAAGAMDHVFPHPMLRSNLPCELDFRYEIHVSHPRRGSDGRDFSQVAR